MTSNRRITARLHISRDVIDEHRDGPDAAHEGRHVTAPKPNATPERAEELARLERQRREAADADGQSDRKT